MSPVQSPLPDANTILPSMQITSPQDGQQVSAGELTIEGRSSDDVRSSCQVYADVNDITPMRKVTAAGDTEDPSDFSKWSFTYNKDYQLIKEGENELTAKISCYENNNPASNPISEWHTVNVTAKSSAIPEILIIPVTPPPSVPNFGQEIEDRDSGDSDDDDDDEGDADDD